MTETKGFGHNVEKEVERVDGFSCEQVADLSAKLDIRNVKKRSGGGGMQLSYIEGHHAIREANRIFGFGQWDRRLEELTLTSEVENDKGQWRVSYLAKVQIIVQVPEAKESIVREGIGAGHGYSRNPGEAHEAAAKEAETAAMKRALMTFGNPFGLALYDKDQTEVEVEVYDYALPEPKNGGTRDDVVAWVTSQGGRVEGDRVKATNPIPRLEQEKAKNGADNSKNGGRSIEMNPESITVSVRKETSSGTA